MNEPELTIGAVAKRANLRTSALRYYESVGLVPEAQRVNGQRRYEPSIFARLQVIHLAQQAGFRVAEIQTLLNDAVPEATPRERWRPLAERKLGEIDALIQRAQQTKQLLHQLQTCDCADLEACGVAAEVGGL